MSEDCMKVRESSEQKRRRGRVSDEQNELERKNTLGKK